MPGPAKLQWFCLLWVFGKRFCWSFNSSRYITITMDPNYILCSVPYAFSIKATAVRLLTLLIARCLSMNKIPNRVPNNTHIKKLSQGIEIIQLTSKFCYKLQFINCCRSQISLKVSHWSNGKKGKLLTTWVIFFFFGSLDQRLSF